MEKGESCGRNPTGDGCEQGREREYVFCGSEYEGTTKDGTHLLLVVATQNSVKSKGQRAMRSDGDSGVCEM